MKPKAEMIPEVAARICSIREGIGLSQKEFGAVLVRPNSGKRFSQSAIKNYETRNIPEAHVLLQIAELGRTSVDWILTGEPTASGAVADIFSEQIAEFRQFWTVELPGVVERTGEKMETQVRLLHKLRDEFGADGKKARKLNPPLTARGIIHSGLHNREIKGIEHQGKGSAKAGSSRAVSKGRVKGG